MKKELAAFQGEPGAFSEAAARRLLGDGVKTLPCPRFDAVFAAVANGQATAAIIPIENTLHGSVHENYDLLLRHKLDILGETHVQIVHNLIAPPGVKMKDIRRVYSHPVALNQCLTFFSDHPELERVPFYDTAGSVKMVMTDRPAGAAAIASATAAATYGAKILKKGIEDDPQNYTRFFLLRLAQPEPADSASATEWKTSLVFSVKNAPGALFRSLSAFALRDLSLTKIESRPLKGRPYEYLFYLDFLGHADDPASRRALDHLAEYADLLRVLGCYPRGI